MEKQVKKKAHSTFLKGSPNEIKQKSFPSKLFILKKCDEYADFYIIFL